jgi:hypothetical protein
MKSRQSTYIQEIAKCNYVYFIAILNRITWAKRYLSSVLVCSLGYGSLIIEQLPQMSEMVSSTEDFRLTFILSSCQSEAQPLPLSIAHDCLFNTFVGI